MQTIWTRLANKVVRSHLVLLSPVVVHSNLPELLRTRKGGLEAVDSACEVVL